MFDFGKNSTGNPWWNKKNTKKKKAPGARSTAGGGDELVGRAENTTSEMFSAAALWSSLEADNFQENQINFEVDRWRGSRVSYPATARTPGPCVCPHSPGEKNKKSVGTSGFPASSAPSPACSPGCCSKLLSAGPHGFRW